MALGGLLVLAVALFLLWGLRAPVAFILSLRSEKLAALVLVGAATGAATVIFQTIAANRLLTPGIVGFDALFIFIQTTLVMILGGVGYADLPETPKFLAEAACLTAAAMALFGVLFRKGAEDVIRMILTGVILGALLRGLAEFVQRLLDPSEFAVVQQASIASFNSVDEGQLGIAAVVLVGNFSKQLPGHQIAAQYVGRTIDICNSEDPVCSGRLPNDLSDIQRVWNDHLQDGYISSGLVKQAADFAAARVR